MRRPNRTRSSSLACMFLLAVTAPYPGEAAHLGGASGHAIQALRTGDCLVSVLPGTEVRAVQKVPCNRPHKVQVLGKVEIAARTYARSALASESLEACSERLRSTIPYAVEDAHAYLMWFQPLPRAWVSGDREVTCMLASSEMRIGNDPY